MWQELVAVGVEPLTTPEQVDEVLGAKSGTVLVIVNSICGCAPGHARPGVMLSLQNPVIPDRYVTVFAGVDRDAVNRAREYMPAYAPSSPSMGLSRTACERLYVPLGATCEHGQQYTLLTSGPPLYFLRP